MARCTPARSATLNTGMVGGARGGDDKDSIDVISFSLAPEKNHGALGD
jgi:hypothetical protein